MTDVIGLVGDGLVGVSLGIAAFAAKWARDAARAGRDTVAPLERVAKGMETTVVELQRVGAGIEATVAEQRRVLEASRELVATLRTAQREARVEARLHALQLVKAALSGMWQGLEEMLQYGRQPPDRYLENRAELRGALALLPPTEFAECRTAANARYEDGSVGGAIGRGDIEVDKAIHVAHQELAELSAASAPGS